VNATPLPLDRRSFILAHTGLLPVPHAPEISLHVAQEATELWQKTEDELATIGLPPPFWAFAWAGGQALARYLLDDPTVVAGRRLLDFASGSGLVAIAAAKAGAARVTANDIDAFATEAIALNAAANGVTVEVLLDDLVGRDGGWEVICAGDVCYEREMAGRVVDWLSVLAARGTTVLIGDPGRSYLPRDRLAPLASYEVPVTRSLEDAEIKRSTVWRLTA
jgi:predicted nicotinamide N-methyase